VFAEFYVRRLTLWFRTCWANPELVGFPAPSHPAQRDVAKTHVSPGSVAANPWRTAYFRVTFRLADVAIGKIPPSLSTAEKLYSSEAYFSTLFNPFRGA